MGDIGLCRAYYVHYSCFIILLCNYDTIAFIRLVIICCLIFNANIFIGIYYAVYVKMFKRNFRSSIELIVLLYADTKNRITGLQTLYVIKINSIIK